MKRFRYKSIKRIRELEEKLAEEAFLEAIHRLRQLANDSKRYSQLYKTYREQFTRGEISWEEMINLIKRIDTIRKMLQEAYNIVEEKRRALTDANIKLKMMEKLEDKWKEEVFQEEMRVLAEILDDFGSYKTFIKSQ